MEMNFQERINEESKNYKGFWNNRKKSAFKLSASDIRQIFSITHEVNLERNEKGIPIPGTGRIITNEEKKAVFDFILENNYPLTRKVYNVVLNAYLNNEIELSLNKTQKL